MPNLGKAIIHIPARAGSKRVPMKNLRMIGDMPMIGYGISAAKHFSDIAEVLVNTDSPEIMSYAESVDVGVYKRDPTLANDTATGDDFTIDIIEKLNPNTLIMISPVCPLISVDDIRGAIDAFQQSKDADTLISVTETSMQTVFKDDFINIEPKGPLAPSQENEKIKICNWGITIWNANEFRKNYKQYQGGYCGTNRILYPLHPLHSIKVSNEEDFELVEKLLLSKESGGRLPATYWNNTI